MLLDAGSLGFGTFVRLFGGAMGFAEGVPAGDERNRFLVVHRHAAERLSNVDAGGKRIRIAARPLRINVDQTHLRGAEGFLEVALAAVALVVEPSGLRAPVNILFGLGRTSA